MHARLARRGALALCLAGVGASAQAPLDIRVALVIGNSAYTNAPLANPGNDARAMAATLRQLGFAVTELRDGSKAQIQAAITGVGASLRGKQAIGMLYYAGHGLQVDWHNYMVPVDARIAQVADVPQQTVDINNVIDVFRSAGNRMNILVLDACRDNPFGAAATGKGLAQLDAPSGTFLAYATAPGNVAEDGDATGGNGLYTQFLLQELQKPVTKIEDVFKRVRLNVRKQSQGRQIPWESTSLEDDFFFNTGQRPAAAKPDDNAREAAFALEKADWDKISESRNADDYYAFLLKYPSGTIAQQATAALERLATARTQIVADRNGVLQNPAAPRYRVGDEWVGVRKDLYTGLEMRRERSRVTAIRNGVVELNGGGGLVTIDGGVIKTRFTENFDPPRMDYPGDAFAIGKKWTGRTIETGLNGMKAWREDQVKIVAFEEVTVPAGTFKAYKFEMDSLNARGMRVKLTYWAQPDWPHVIKQIRIVRPPKGPEIRESVEMVHRQRGAG